MDSSNPEIRRARCVGSQGRRYRRRVDEISDLTNYETCKDVQALVARTFPTDSMGRRANYTEPLWDLRGRIEHGDILALPMKTTG
jgi:predicted Mrr-cat superfamily restriction endonuclease